MKEYLTDRIVSRLRGLGVGDPVRVQFEKPRQAEHGDLTTNIAMTLAKQLGKKPKTLAGEILEGLGLDPTLVDRAEVAGPGFLNFHFTDKFYFSQLQDILAKGTSFGRTNVGRRRKTQVEFVSANPTGPLTVGHGRNAVYGDTVANLLEWTNNDVTREYYFNNAGRQMRVLGDSVRLRYRELLGEKVEFPDDYYQGEYIKDIAQRLVEEHGDKLRQEPSEGIFREVAEQEIFADIKKTLERLNIEFDSFFNENTLYQEGKIDEIVADFKAKGLAYEKEGAVWFRATEFGSEKDKVIVKSTGEPTYRLPDIAYHREKFRRGFELMVDILGADHIATYPDVLAGLDALGYDSKRVKVLIHQFVTIVQDGEVVKMSTRKANFITLDDLIDEVGADVVRYFFLMRSIGSHLNFDLKLAKEQSDENPVYYLQYAHARIASIVRYAEAGGVWVDAHPDISKFTTSEEIDLMKKLTAFPDVVESCAATYEPHRLADYLHEVAGVFHRFYHQHRVVSEDLPLSASRLALCQATKTVLANGCSILGIAAPERM
jgi:arginyl-tRNA synthetase